MGLESRLNGELATGAGQTTFQCADRNAQNLGSILVVKTLEVDQDDRGALFYIQTV